MTHFSTSRPKRALTFTGVSNFRDIGGYSTPDGPVKWGQIYRSAHLADLHASDVQKLQALNIKGSIDLRGQIECTKRPYDYAFLERNVCSIEPKVAYLVDEAVSKHGSLSTQEAHAYMQAMYQSFYTDYTAQFKKAFDIISNEKTPLVIHCTAGKDRTGFAVALLLTILGVHRDDILEDYLLTKQYYHKLLTEEPGINLACMRILWGVSAQYLEQCFQQLDREYGSVLSYSQNKLDLSDIKITQLKERLIG